MCLCTFVSYNITKNSELEASVVTSQCFSLKGNALESIALTSHARKWIVWCNISATLFLVNEQLRCRTIRAWVHGPPKTDRFRRRVDIASMMKASSNDSWAVPKA